MFTIRINDHGVVELEGRLDASQTEEAARVLETIATSMTVDFKNLEYISSAGLGVLFAHQKRLKSAGQGLRLINLNPHIRDVFRYARFDMIFQIE